MMGSKGQEAAWGCVLPSYHPSFIYNHKPYLGSLSLSSSFLKVPGADLQNVCHLQTPEDSSKVLELAAGKNLVIVGASFVGTMLEGLLGLENWALKCTSAV